MLVAVAALASTHARKPALYPKRAKAKRTTPKAYANFSYCRSSRADGKIARIVANDLFAVKKSLRQGDAMVSSAIHSPSHCSAQELADFENLIIEAGAVDPEGLTQRIQDAFRLLFLREANAEVVGVGALKHPLLGYRNGVFAKAGIANLSDAYRIELGWVAVAKSQQGRGLSSRIISELISLAGNQNLFATTRADARAIRLAADYGFKPAGKPYPSGRGYDLVLYLRSAGKDGIDDIASGEV